MTKRTGLALPIIGVLAGISVAWAQGLVPQRLRPDQYKWAEAKSNVPGTAMTPGMQSIYVVGDGAKPGLYSRVTRIPPNTKIQPHSHPDDRSCFVLSGMWYFGFGNVRDESKLQALPPGSTFTEPARVIHFAGTKDVETVVECTAIGPTDTYYVDATNDPRNAKK